MKDPYLFFVLSWVFHAIAVVMAIAMLLIATRSQYAASLVLGMFALLSTVVSDIAYNVYMTPPKRK